MDEKLSTKKAAEIMGVTPQFIRIGLQNQRFPFGVAVKFKKRWSYYINKKRFFIFIHGKDIKTNSDTREVNCY